MNRIYWLSRHGDGDGDADGNGKFCFWRQHKFFKRLTQQNDHECVTSAMLFCLGQAIPINIIVDNIVIIIIIIIIMLPWLLCCTAGSKYPKVNTCIACFRYQSACLPDRAGQTDWEIESRRGRQLARLLRPPSTSICVLIDALKSVEFVQFCRPSWVDSRASLIDRPAGEACKDGPSSNYLFSLQLPLCVRVLKINFERFPLNQIAWHCIYGSMGFHFAIQWYGKVARFQLRTDECKCRVSDWATYAAYA